MHEQIENEKKIAVTKQDIIKKEDDKNLSIVSDEALLDVYGEIMNNLRSDRSQVAELVDTFSNMVVNEGDSSTSSKEALINLLKTKIEASDKMSRIADLMTRIKLKQPDTYQPWMNKGKEGSTINIYDSGGVNRKSLMEKIQKEKENEK